MESEESGLVEVGTHRETHVLESVWGQHHVSRSSIVVSQNHLGLSLSGNTAELALTGEI